MGDSSKSSAPVTAPMLSRSGREEIPVPSAAVIPLISASMEPGAHRGRKSICAAAVANPDRPDLVRSRSAPSVSAACRGRGDVDLPADRPRPARSFRPCPVRGRCRQY